MPTPAVTCPTHRVRQQLEWCGYPRPAERFQTVAHHAGGTAFLRYFDQDRQLASYVVGFSDDYLVAVVSVGREGGDITTAIDVGSAALRRIGGQAGPLVVNGVATSHRTTREATVHAARLGASARTISIDAGAAVGPHCGHLVRVGRTATGPAATRATIVADDLTGDSLPPCAGERRTDVTLHLPADEPPDALVLNGRSWVRSGTVYQRQETVTPRR